ncbi:MAG: TRZ/ATZ family hydrolase [Gammaproteobacteria bacterium]|nr:TRZ/ATZ family hydrolase [Gammaproteobacteria bacterium]MDH5801256.1 TRZ/ATZ family hydrolase [Gammaproteobacteria bacterium]
MDSIDTLIHAKWIIPVEPAATVYTDHSLALHEGRILSILPQEQARRQYQADTVHELRHHALIPGLINCHTHAAMSLFRGLADDLPLMDWLQNHIWPAEGRWVNNEFVHDGTQLALAEMIRGGITCFNDMYFFPDETARIADLTGMRATVGLILIDFPTVWAADADEYLHKGLEVHDRFRHNPLISTAFAPHAPYTVSDPALEKVVTLAEELDLPIHMHVHETAFEVQQAQQDSGKRPIQRLQELGLVSPRLLAVHMTQLNDAEMSLFAQAGAHVVHCPESNLKLASGFCPVHALSLYGVNIAIGTDGAASNNDLDMLGEMRSAALLAKAVSQDASAIPAENALRMATINGAKALGLDHKIGSLVPGKAADITAINMDDLGTQPVYNPVSQIVYACTRQQVTDVWVAGKQLLRRQALTTIDEQAIKHKAQLWREKIYQADQHPENES